MGCDELCCLDVEMLKLEVYAVSLECMGAHLKSVGSILVSILDFVGAFFSSVEGSDLFCFSPGSWSQHIFVL